MHENDGLIASAHRGFDRLKKADLELLGIFIAMAVGIVSVVYYSRARATDNMNYVVLCGLGIAAVIFAKTGASGFVRSLYHRQSARMLGYCVILAAAYAWDFNAHLAVGSANQSGLSSIQRAAFTATSTRDQQVNEAKEALATAKSDAAEIRKQGWEPFPAHDGKSLTSVAAVDAALQVTEAHRFFKVTDSCKATKGPQTRAFCDGYADLKASRAKVELMLKERESLPAAEARVKEAEARLAAARNEQASTPMTLSEDRADAQNLVKLAGMLGFEAYDVNFGNAALFAAALLIFISLTEAIRTAKEFDGMPRKPWPLIAKLKALLIGGKARAKVDEAIWTTTTAQPAQQDRTTVVHVNDAELRHVLRKALGSNVRAAA